MFKRFQTKTTRRRPMLQYMQHKSAHGTKPGRTESPIRAEPVRPRYTLELVKFWESIMFEQPAKSTRQNGIRERMQRSLIVGLSHYIKATNINLDVLTPFFLMAYRATPNIVTAISIYYLRRGREMLLLTHDNLKLKISSQPLDHNQ